MSNVEAREELARIAASLRAYLEWQVDCGSSGIPRRPREARVATSALAPASAAVAPARSAIEPSDDPVPADAAASSEEAPSPVREPAPSRAVPAESPAASLPPITVTEPIVAPPPSPRAKAPAPTPPTAVVPARPLPVIASEVATCAKCGLAATRTNTVFARGNPEAKVVFIGEAPGADEDEQGIPFVGRAGQLLDKMIQAMGLDPAKDVYVCNIIKCRPPDNRRPEPDEVATCIPYLHEQIAQLDPKVIVLLGNTSVAALLGTKLGITKVRGSWKLYRGKIPVMPTYHPSYLLRPSAQQTEAKRQAWEDLQAVMKELGLSKPARS